MICSSRNLNGCVEIVRREQVYGGKGGPVALNVIIGIVVKCSIRRPFSCRDDPIRNQFASQCIGNKGKKSIILSFLVKATDVPTSSSHQSWAPESPHPPNHSRTTDSHPPARPTASNLSCRLQLRGRPYRRVPVARYTGRRGWGRRHR